MTLLRAAKPFPASTSPQSTRYLNELRALDVLFREGGMSRAELARALGLNRSTTGSIIANLLAEAFVVEHADPKRPATIARTGRPGIGIELNPAGASFIGVGIEADRLTALTIDLAGAVVRKKTAPFHVARHSPDKAAAAAAKLINALIEAEPARGRIRGVCVAVPAMIAEGVVIEAALLGWRAVDFARLLSGHLVLDLPVSVENDANAFAIAETYGGTRSAASTVAFILVESGAGGGIVINGRLIRGGFGLAGEFGHLRVGRRGYADGRSKPGLLETYIGKEALLARYATHGGAPGTRLGGFIEALERGEAAALRTADDWARWLAQGIHAIVNVLNPALIIIGGPVGAVFRFMAPRVNAALRAKLPEGLPLPAIELSRFGPEGPAYGGALLLHQRAFSVDEKALYPDGGARGLLSPVDG